MGGALRGCLGYLGMESEGATTKDIQELKGIMGRGSIFRKGRHTESRILKLLIYGDQQMRETQIKIERIRESPKEFVMERNE